MKDRANTSAGGRKRRARLLTLVVLLDDECAIGTANFDNRSFRLNFEITLQFTGREFTDQVAAMLERDFADARAMSSAQMEAQGFWFRVAARAARLAAPIQ